MSQVTQKRYVISALLDHRCEKTITATTKREATARAKKLIANEHQVPSSHVYLDWAELEKDLV